MERFLSWVKRRADNNVVTYSRFGLPGDEIDDRPPPSKIFVQGFDENDRIYMIFGTHVTRAACINAGIGMSATIFLFLSFFFEFDWYEHNKGVDIGALIALFLFLGSGLVSHMHVLRGLKTNDPFALVPVIMIYFFLIVIELMIFLMLLNNFLASTLLSSVENKPSIMISLFFFFFFTIIVQYFMLLSYRRCRVFIDHRRTYEMERKLAENAKRINPSIEIVFVGRKEKVSEGIDNDSSGNVSNSPTAHVILAANDQIA